MPNNVQYFNLHQCLTLNIHAIGHEKCCHFINSVHAHQIAPCSQMGTSVPKWERLTKMKFVPKWEYC